MTNSAWAQAILAGCDAVKATYGAPITTAEAEAFARAALPHLLRGVTEGMDLKALNGLLCQMDSQYCEEDMRAALLAALTDAAGRVE